MRRRSVFLVSACFLLFSTAWAESPAAQSTASQKPAAQVQPPAPPPPLVSPEVHSDRTVTFRFRDPNAKEVSLNLEGAGKPQPMVKDDQGVWRVTTQPL